MLVRVEIASQMEPYLAQAKSYYSQPGCYSPNGHYGMFPPCVPPPAVVHPIEGAADFPGYVVLRITRKSSPESMSAIESETKDKVKIRVECERGEFQPHRATTPAVASILII